MPDTDDAGDCCSLFTVASISTATPTITNKVRYFLSNKKVTSTHIDAYLFTEFFVVVVVVVVFHFGFGSQN